MKIYVDADGCPVKDEIYKVAHRYQLDVVLVANKSITIPFAPSISLKVVPQGPDEADNWIAETICANDICVTADIPLADRCLKQNARVVDPRGKEFTEDSIGEMMGSRELFKMLRENGEFTGGPPPFEKKDRSNFLQSLDRMIQSIRRKSL